MKKVASTSQRPRRFFSHRRLFLSCSARRRSAACQVTIPKFSAKGFFCEIVERETGHSQNRSGADDDQSV